MSNNEYNYALAFYNLAEEENKLTLFFEDLLNIDETLKNNIDLVKLLDCYNIDNDKKNEVIDSCFSFIKEDYSKDFIKLIVSKHLIKNFPKIFDCFHQIYNDKMNIQNGIIYSVVSLSDSQIKEIENSFLIKRNQKVELKNVVDKNLIGGIKVVIKDQIFDGSIKNKLESMKNSLKKEGD